jgi:hypothetical protein
VAPELARPGVVPGQLPADEAFRSTAGFHGDDFKVECPAGSGIEATLWTSRPISLID